MKRYYITYTDKGFFNAQQYACACAKNFNFDYIISYTKADIDNEFYLKNKDILEESRGAGYWLWKFYIIYHTLLKMRNDDILFYCDAGKNLIHSIDPLIEILYSIQQPIMPYQQLVEEKVWTKRDLFIYNNCDLPLYTDTNHYDSSTHLVIKNKESLDFYKTCLDQGCIKELITDSSNIYGKGNYPEFKEHRHDQSIYSVQVKLKNYKGFRMLHHYGMPPHTPLNAFTDSTYPQIVNHHGIKN